MISQRKLYDKYQVGQKITVFYADGNYSPMSAGCRIRKICKDTIHLEWEGDRSYYGYGHKDETWVKHNKEINKCVLMPSEMFDEMIRLSLKNKKPKAV